MQRHNKGRKTPGGVFIALLKKHADVDQNELAKVLDQHAFKPWANATRQKKLRQTTKPEIDAVSDVVGDVVKMEPKTEPQPTLDKAMFFSPEANLY